MKPEYQSCLFLRPRLEKNHTVNPKAPVRFLFFYSFCFPLYWRIASIGETLPCNFSGLHWLMHLWSGQTNSKYYHWQRNFILSRICIGCHFHYKERKNKILTPYLMQVNGNSHCRQNPEPACMSYMICFFVVPTVFSNPLKNGYLKYRSYKIL